MKVHEMSRIFDRTSPDDEEFGQINLVNSRVSEIGSQKLRPNIREHVQDRVEIFLYSVFL